MAMFHRGSAFLTMAVLVCAPGWATSEVTAPPDVLERGRKAIQRYARDTTETPLDVKTTVSVYDTRGTLRKSSTSTHRFEVVSYRHREDEGTTGKMVSRMRSLRNASEQFNADASVFFLFIALEQPANKTYLMLSTPGSVRVSWSTGGDCEGFVYERRGPWFAAFWLKGFWLEGPCGKGEFEFDERNFTPLRSTFQADGLPMTVGKKTLRAFRAEQEFQAVNIPGSMQLLILPKTVVTTVETHKGTTVVRSEYTLHQSQRR